MKRALTNDFSWSKSRHEKLTECKRAYYFQYYGSWGGWDKAAPPEARELYLLKKLGNRYTWAGGIVHETLREALLAIRAGRNLAVDGIIEGARQQMRRDFQFSKTGGYRRERHRKEFAGLVEHEYQEPIPPEAWKANWEAVKAALTWFFSSRWPALARTLAPSQWLEVDVMDFERSIFHLEGVKVFAVPDFAYLDPDGAPVVVDWKTGKVRGGYDEQVLGYALYLSNRYGVPLTRTRAALVYLNEGAEQAVQIHEEAVEGFKAHFRQSVAQMRSLLVDPRANEPAPQAAFPMTDDRLACGRCAFRRACRRGGEAALGAS